MSADPTTLTSKGQVTVPREIRDRLGLKSGDKMAFTLLSDGTVVMRPKTRRLAELAGMLTRPGQPKVAIEEMNAFRDETTGALARQPKQRARQSKAQPNEAPAPKRQPVKRATR